MNREPVTSSNVVSIGYDAQSETLEVEFRNSQVYQYADVPQQIYSQLIAAQSIGRFMHDYIVGQYTSTKL